MQIKFWGTRGSLPQPFTGDHLHTVFRFWLKKCQEKNIDSVEKCLNHIRCKGTPKTYAGHTTCIEITHQDHLFFFDLGSGLQAAGSQFLESPRGEYHFLLSHMHWDHLIGMPYFLPLYESGTRMFIYHVHEHAPEYVKIKFNGINFPIKWADLSTKIEFVPLVLYKPFVMKDLAITPFLLDHPGQCYGYHFETKNKKMSIGFDGEYRRHSRLALGKDLAYYQNLDLLVFDGQYDPEQLECRAEWGHSTPEKGVDLALRENIRKVVFTHHDPWSTDLKIENMLRDAKLYCQKQYSSEYPTIPELLMAYDGLTLEV